MSRAVTNITQALLIVVSVLLVDRTSAQTPPVTRSADIATQRLNEELARIAKLAKGRVGMSALHLESGRHVSLNPTDSFPMASTVKVAIAAQLLHRIEQGQLSMMTMTELKPDDLHPGSGTLDVLFAKPGVQLSVQNLLELMIVISDNSATDILLRLAGGPRAVQQRLDALGIRGRSVDRSIIQLLADLEGVVLPPADQWALGFYGRLGKTIKPEQAKAAVVAFNKDPRDRSTPDAMVNLLAQLYRGTALQPASRDTLLAVMARCRGGANRLKGYLPPGTVVAHKTGSLDETATDDVGVITLPGDAGHIAIAVFVGYSTQPLADREQVIAQLTRSIYDYFLYQPTPQPTATR